MIDRHMYSTFTWANEMADRKDVRLIQSRKKDFFQFKDFTTKCYVKAKYKTQQKCPVVLEWKTRKYKHKSHRDDARLIIINNSNITNLFLYLSGSS